MECIDSMNESSSRGNILLESEIPSMMLNVSQNVLHYGIETLLFSISKILRYKETII